MPPSARAIIWCNGVPRRSSWFIAAREALDLDWTQTIVTVLLGWGAIMVFGFIATLILGVLGLGAAGLMGAFS